MISNPIPWPDGARCAVAITLDLDADSPLRSALGADADNRVSGRLARWTNVVELNRYMQLQDGDWIASLENIATYVTTCIDSGV